MKELVFGEWIPIEDYNLYEEAYHAWHRKEEYEKFYLYSLVASFYEDGWCLGGFLAYQENDGIGGKYFRLPPLQEDIQELVFGLNEGCVEDIIAKPITHFMFVKSPSVKKKD